MDKNKAQKFVLSEMLKNDKVAFRSPVEDNSIYISPNRVVGFVFSRESLMIDLTKIKTGHDVIDFDSIYDDTNQLKLTKRIIDTDGSSGGYLSVLENNAGKSVYISTKWLQYFGGCAEFYQGTVNGPVVIVEADEIKGTIMPCKYYEQAQID